MKNTRILNLFFAYALLLGGLVLPCSAQEDADISKEFRSMWTIEPEETNQYYTMKSISDMTGDSLKELVYLRNYTDDSYAQVYKIVVLASEDGHELWSTTAAELGISSLSLLFVHQDINGDNIEDIALKGQNKFFILDSKMGKEILLSYELTDNAYREFLAVPSVDGDEYDDIVIACEKEYRGDDSVHMIKGNPHLSNEERLIPLWESFKSAKIDDIDVIRDVDGDHIKDIVATANFAESPEVNSTYLLSGATGNKIWAEDFPVEDGKKVTAISVKAKSLMGPQDVLTIDDSQDKLYRINGKTGAKLWEFGCSDYIDDVIPLNEDINNDGWEDIILNGSGCVQSGRDYELLVLDGKGNGETTNVLWYFSNRLFDHIAVISDINKNGFSDIATVETDYNSLTSKFSVLDGKTSEELRYFELSNTNEQFVINFLAVTEKASGGIKNRIYGQQYYDPMQWPMVDRNVSIYCLAPSQPPRPTTGMQLGEK